MKHSILAILLFILIGCGGNTTEDIVYDMILRLPEAQREYDLSVVDLSNPDDFQYLGKGWHVPGIENVPVTRFVWSAEKDAVVNFNTKTVEEKELILTVRPYIFEGVPPGILDLTFNDEKLGKIRLKDNWRTYRLTVPANLISPDGKNQLVITQALLFKPDDVMFFSGDNRDLGSSYSYFVLRTKTNPLPPDLYTLPQILGADHFIWGGKQRYVIYDKVSSSFTWTVDLPSNPILSFGAGFMPEDYYTDGSNAEFFIYLEDTSGKSHTLFHADMPPPKRLLEMGWDDYSRNISEFANQKVKITLKTPSADCENLKPNVGSWLEPVILNRHTACNIILLPGVGEYPPENPVAGAAHEKLAFSTGKTRAISTDTMDTDHGLPVKLIELLKSEGWPIGYFYTGLDIGEVENLYGRKFDSVAGEAETTLESGNRLIEQSIDWIKRLEGRNYVLVFNPFNADSATQIELLDTLTEWLFEHRYETDSLVLLYNHRKDARIWLLNPSDQKQSQLEISDWPELVDYVNSEILGIKKLH